MVAESTDVERLVTSWESIEDELRDAGYEREADIVAVCRDALAGQLDRENGSRVRVLLRVWADDAAVLKTYGFQSAAESLWRCRQGLEAALEDELALPEPGRTRRRPSDLRPGEAPVPPPGSLRPSSSSNGTAATGEE